MKLSSINLNLLISFDALMREKNVTKAGERIFITQSAMSNSLSQLREIFNDELFIRSPGGMIPTQKAHQLKPLICQFINTANNIFNYNQIFDPATSTRKFRIGMSDVIEFAILPHLLDKLKKLAPNIEIHIKHCNLLNTEKPFINNEIELGIAHERNLSPSLNSEVIFSLEGVVVARNAHPIFKDKITLDNYLKYKHARIQYYDDWQLTAIDKELKKLGVKREVVLSLPHVTPLFFALRKSDLIGTIPNIICQETQRKLSIKTAPLPFQPENCNYALAWLKQCNNDQGLKWLKELIISLAKDRAIKYQK